MGGGRADRYKDRQTEPARRRDRRTKRDIVYVIVTSSKVYKKFLKSRY